VATRAVSGGVIITIIIIIIITIYAYKCLLSPASESSRLAKTGGIVDERKVRKTSISKFFSGTPTLIFHLFR
jgi:uncharacterized membrane protein YqiK